MTNQALYDAALRLASEVYAEGENADYEERAEYLLGVLCLRYASLDEAYRTANGLEKASLPTLPHLPLSEEFPLCEVFSAPLSSALAALLVATESPSLANRLERLAADSLDAIRQAIPFQSERITDRYSLFGSSL